MKKSRNIGMQTFDQALFDLFESNLITYEDALRNADSVNDLRLQIKLNSQRARPGSGRWYRASDDRLAVRCPRGCLPSRAFAGSPGMRHASGVQLQPSSIRGFS